MVSFSQSQPHCAEMSLVPARVSVISKQGRIPLQDCAHCKKNIAFVVSGKHKEDSQQLQVLSVPPDHSIKRSRKRNGDS